MKEELFPPDVRFFIHGGIYHTPTPPYRKFFSDGTLSRWHIRDSYRNVNTAPIHETPGYYLLKIEGVTELSDEQAAFLCNLIDYIDWPQYLRRDAFTELAHV